MIDSFDNVINRDTFSDIYCVCLKNQPGLIFTELATLYVIGIIGHPYLKLMVQTSGHTDVFFVSEHLKQTFSTYAPGLFFLK